MSGMNIQAPRLNALFPAHRQRETRFDLRLPERRCKHLEVLTAIAAEQRIEILLLLSQGPCNVSTLGAELELADNSMSYHLRILRECHLVEFKRLGTQRIYRLARHVSIGHADGFVRLEIQLPDGGKIVFSFPAMARHA